MPVQGARPRLRCGNFLYVAYRELRALEHDLKQRIRTLTKETGLPAPPGPEPYVPLRNMQGLDIERSAILIARVTMWMGHRQMIDRYGDAEAPLPLQDLSSIRVADALRTPWPETDCIIGNPPFLGSQHIRASFGDEYVDWLKRQFGVGVKDFCTYWFRLAADHLKPGQRAGLVGTNSISQNRARSVSLDYVVERGGVIVDAVSSQKWPGDAKVHVSLVNWVDEPTQSVDLHVLDGVPVTGIRSDLTESSGDDWEPVALGGNRDHCFQGMSLVGGGFLMSSEEAQAVLSQAVEDQARFVRPFVTSEDLARRTDQSASRWVIDLSE